MIGTILGGLGGRFTDGLSPRAKAWVSALVAFGAFLGGLATDRSVAAILPPGWIPVIGAVASFIAWLSTWAVPNKEAPEVAAARAAVAARKAAEKAAAAARSLPASPGDAVDMAAAAATGAVGAGVDLVRDILNRR